MYISVENYEEMYLKNKGADAVEREVEKMRSEICKLKRKMEAPSYSHASKSFPSDDQIIEIYRSYLDKAEEVLSELRGGVCVLTEEERVAGLVDSMTESIECVTLTVGRYLEDKYELSLSGSSAKITEIHLGEDHEAREVDKDEALAALRAIRIGEWRANYLPEQYGCTLNEPVKWQVRIDYSGGAAPAFYDGLGIFPYNFSALCKLLGAEVY